MNRTLSPRQWALALALVLAALLAVTPFLDQRAVDNYESLFQRALVTFALARTLNGVISAVQGTEVAIQPAGVGVTLTPGEILDPVNDLVERFSWVMLGATISLGIQQVLLEVSAWWVLQALVVVLAAWLLVLHLRPSNGSSATRRLLGRAFLIALFMRFAVPLTLVANEAVYDLFLEQRYEQSTEVINNAGEALERIGVEMSEQGDPGPGPAQQGEDDGLFGGLFGSVGRAWNSALGELSLGEKIERIQARAGDLIEHLVQLSVVFILQTGILPIVFLWLFLQLARWVLRPARN